MARKLSILTRFEGKRFIELMSSVDQSSELCCVAIFWLYLKAFDYFNIFADNLKLGAAVKPKLKNFNLPPPPNKF